VLSTTPLTAAHWSALRAWRPAWREQRPDVEPLVPDASARRYYRLRDAGGSVVVLLQPHAFAPEEDDFLRLAAFFRDHDWPVPVVEAIFAEVGLVLLEDLGDTVLHAADGLASYEAAIDLLVDLQGIRAPAAATEPPWNRRFDAPFYQRELTLFIDAFQRLTGAGDPAARDGFLRQTAPLCEALAELPLVVCHRDYHRRNLLVREGRVRPIDFQDARLGPRGYDLASLLEDPYADLDDGQRRHLLARYRAASDTPLSDEEYALAAVQRLLKAAGTYANQAVHRTNRAYLPYLAPALAGAQRTMRGLAGRFDPLAGTIDRLCAAWEAHR